MEVDLAAKSGPVPDPAIEATPVLAAAPTAGPPSVPTVQAYRDRGTGLVFFGVVQIILGLLAALMIPLAALGALMSRLSPGGTLRPGQFVSSIATYAFMAAVLVGLGVGSVQMKRWARALTLVFSWYRMIVGALITVLLTAMLPVTMRGAMAQAQRNSSGAPLADISTGVMAVILTIMIVFCAFFLVLVPIAFVVFYRRKDVIETCHHRDPVERWTDRVPLPVLGGCLIFFTGALYMLMMSVTTPLFPLFGLYLTGIAGATCLVVMAALDLYLAVAFYRLQSSGWWIAVLAVPLHLLSAVITFTRADMMQAYSRMGLSDAQLKMINSNPMLHGHVILWWSLVSGVVFLGYLLWLKRYFKTPAAPFRAETVPVQIG